MRPLFRAVRQWRFYYEPLVEVLVYRDALLHNLNVFRSRYRPVGVAPVLKSNAYGHGLVLVAKILDIEKPPFLCVDSYFEALVLRNEGIASPILIIGYTALENIVRSRLRNVAFAIISLDELKRLATGLRARTKIHLKVDTGMHRHGIAPEEIDEALELIRRTPHIELEGVYSHLADADTKDSRLTRTQIERWNGIAAKVRRAFPHVSHLHIAATTGSFHSPKIDANVLRLGIGLYGMNVSLEKLDLHPALKMRTRITSLRLLHRGEKVGYNATFTARRDMIVASIPAGYTEGIDRRLSNVGALTVRGIPCRIVGRVSMNITSLDVSAVPGIKLDDEVVVVSRNPTDPNSTQNMARQCKTIPYELLVHIPAQLRRRVVQGD